MKEERTFICPLMSGIVPNNGFLQKAFVECLKEKCIAWEKGTDETKPVDEKKIDPPWGENPPSSYEMEMYPHVPPHCRVFQGGEGGFSKMMRSFFGRN